MTHKEATALHRQSSTVFRADVRKRQSALERAGLSKQAAFTRAVLHVAAIMGRPEVLPERRR